MPVTTARPEKDRQTHEAPLARRALVELVGTFATTLVAAGAPIIDAATSHGLSHTGRDAAQALMTAALVYAVGDVSGAHLNPLVTLAFVLRGVFHVRFVLAYLAAQLAGALAAAGLLRAMFPPIAALAETHPLGAVEGWVFELILTLLLVAVILNTSTQHKVVGPNAALAVGATIAVCRFLAAPLTGASMNPFRSLAPAIVNGHFADLPLYVVAPSLGAGAAVVLTRLFHGPPRDGERSAAEGD